MSGKQVFGTMNGLRGIAALVVVAFHSQLRDTLNLNNAFLAVDIFFCLSGFVIAHAYEERLRKDISFKSFAILRIVRLYPLYILGTLFSISALTLSYITNGYLIDNYVMLFKALPFALFMLPNISQAADLSPAPLYPLNEPAWTLFFELVINAIYAATFRFWTEKRVLIVLGSVGSILLVTWALNGFFDGGYYWSNIGQGVFRVFYSFPAGVLVYRLCKRDVLHWSIPSPAIAGLLLVFLLLPFSWIAPFSVLIGFPVLVALAAKSEPRGIFLSIFSSIGAASYAVYAIHFPLHKNVASIYSKLGLPPSLLPDVIFVLAIVPICMLIDKVYDTPVRKLLTRTLSPLSQAKTRQSIAATDKLGN